MSALDRVTRTAAVGSCFIVAALSLVSFLVLRTASPTPGVPTGLREVVLWALLALGCVLPTALGALLLTRATWSTALVLAAAGGLAAALFANAVTLGAEIKHDPQAFTSFLAVVVALLGCVLTALSAKGGERRRDVSRL